MPDLAGGTPDIEARRRVDRVFTDALDRPESERAAFLDAACAGDVGLRRAVDRLLDAERSSADVFDGAMARQTAALAHWLAQDDDRDDPRIGQRLGPWRLCHRLGSGGMAVVYLAERDDGQFTQQVAVKLLRRSLDAAGDVARLRAERAILATLAHPNIATLIDGGTTADGLPYLVTEYVDGLPLTTHCTRHALPVGGRLALFLQVADAVHHAHQKLVVHRDLKPSNVLVDGGGRARLLDFGIAKLLDPSAGADGAPPTRVGHVVMTPEYAAPEQRDGGEVTTATDVYQLGVLLHELLTGVRPASERDGSDGPTVARPSTVVQRGPAAEAAPPLPPSVLARRLRGDLDVIVQTALRARPGDRYPSAAALAADLRNHLAGRAIAARPERASEMLRRLVRRSPWAAAATGLAIVALIGWAGTLQFYSRAVERERDAATAQAERARRANDLLLGVFRRADPLARDGVGGRAATVWQSLDAATDDVRRTLADDPATLAELLDTLSRLYRAGGQLERADALLGEVLALRRQTDGPASAAVAAVLAERGSVARQAGRAEAGRVDLAQALAIVGPMPADAAGLVVSVHIVAGHAAIGDGDARAAAGHFERAADLLRSAERPDPNALIESLFGLGNAQLQLGDLAAAEAGIAESVALAEAVYGAGHPRLAGPLSALGNVQRRRGRPAEAATSLQRAIDAMLPAYGADSDGILSARNNLALALGAAGDGPGQRSELERIIAIKQAAHGPDHAGLADHYQNLGAARAQEGDLDGALAALAEARRLYDTHAGAGSPRPAFPRLTAAAVQIDRGDATAAVREAEAAVAILRRTLPAGHHVLAIGRCLLGEALAGQGRTTEGAALVRDAWPAMSKVPPDQAAYVLRCRRARDALGG